MSQEKILDFLEKNPNRWFTTNEITGFVDISHNAVLENTRRLIGNNRIVFQHRSTTIPTKNGNLRTVLKLYIKHKKKVFIL